MQFFHAQNQLPPCLLDSFASSNIVLAVSNRRLRSAYSGAANQVRSSAGGSQNIGFLINDYNVNALSDLGSNSGFVPVWYDQSGNGNNISNATQSEQPRIRNTGTNETLGSRVAVAGVSGSNSLLSGALASSVTSSALTIIEVANVSAAPNTFFARHISAVNTSSSIADNNSTSTFNVNRTGSSGQMQLERSLSGKTFSVSSASYIIFYEIDGSNINIRVNNTLVHTSSMSGSFNFNRIALFGMMNGNGTNANYSTSDKIAESVIFNTAITSTQRSDLYSNISSYYGV